MAQKTVMTDSIAQITEIFGAFDSNVRELESAFGAQIVNRDGAVVINGESDAVEKTARALEYLKHIYTINGTVNEQNVEYLIGMINDSREDELSELDDDTVCITTKGKPVKAKTVGQKRYVGLIKKNTVVIGVGPAGTGKTFLAVSMAVTALRSKAA